MIRFPWNDILLLVNFCKRRVACLLKKVEFAKDQQKLLQITRHPLRDLINLVEISNRNCYLTYLSKKKRVATRAKNTSPEIHQACQLSTFLRN